VRDFGIKHLGDDNGVAVLVLDRTGDETGTHAESRTSTAMGILARLVFAIGSQRGMQILAEHLAQRIRVPR
jgi:hypothetical protein